jgi:hypothetical protein
MLLGNVILVKRHSLGLVDQGCQATEASTIEPSVNNGSLRDESYSD